MKTVQITEDAVIKAHNEASTKGKTLLENLFNGSVFKKDIKERVKTVDDAIAALGENDPDVIDLKKLINADVAEHIIGNQELVVITKALNEGHVHDWSNGKWDKWFPWFWFNNDKGSSSASRFSFDDSVSLFSGSRCGSRLCFKSKELSDYAGKQFEDLYREYYVIE